jgi:hypothetical protein
VQVACHIPLKISRWRPQLCFRTHFNQRFAHKVMGLQSRGSPNFGDFKTPTWESQDKMTFGCWPRGQAQRILQRGRWWLPPNPGRGESYQFVFAHGSSMHQKCSNYALTNLLFGLCRSMWVIELFITLPSSHPRTLACPFTPKVLRTKEHALTLYLFVILTFRFAVESIKEFGGVSTLMWTLI